MSLLALPTTKKRGGFTFRSPQHPLSKDGVRDLPADFVGIIEFRCDLACRCPRLQSNAQSVLLPCLLDP
eukprot:CAMPEP_0180800712 /NCGR_PEP_ID=MMETSP1038_2-20121128/59236_1 /TAXON_ID=632150 /ORGANISM="Azadinium spinosum, Strain 3D9" /LENGTH=68 /DNA_ID=CAMNT_0022840431 /DNA_START=18 /DNA_END=221 /DNA_ORIENTATION=-